MCTSVKDWIITLCNDVERSCTQSIVFAASLFTLRCMGWHFSVLIANKLTRAKSSMHTGQIRIRNFRVPGKWVSFLCIYLCACVVIRVNVCFYVWICICVYLYMFVGCVWAYGHVCSLSLVLLVTVCGQG